MTHTVLITATDKFLSGWGLAKNGKSRCAWACKEEHADTVYNWVNGRSDMKYVNIHYLRKERKYYPGSGTAHFHIYVVDDNHPALDYKG